MPIQPINPTISFTTPNSAATTDGPLLRFGPPRPLLPNSVFIIMSFGGEGMDEVLAVIKNECAALGLEANRADDSVGSEIVMVRIGEMIEEAELIICDLTYERLNVYYELGYAHAVGNRGNRVLLIARDGTPRPFDVSWLLAHYYSSPETLRGILQRNLPKMLDRCRSMQAKNLDALSSWQPKGDMPTGPTNLNVLESPSSELQPKR